MRVNIKTKSPVRDNDIKSLLLFREAIKLSTPRLLRANAEFVGLSIADMERVKEISHERTH